MSDLTWMALLFARATAILLLGGLLVVLLRRSSSSARHAVLGLTVTGVLILPLVSTVLPGWELAVLPAESPAARASAVGPLSFDQSQRTEGAGSAAQDAGPAAGAPTPHSPKGEVLRSARSSSGATVAPPEGLAPAAVPDEPWPALAWLALAWVVGAAIGMLQIGRSALLARRTRQGATELVDPAWTQEVEHASRVLGLRQRVRLLMSDAVRVPVVHGFRPPAILLPTSAVDWPEDRRRAFLLHELAHVRRQDWPVQMLGHLARALYWPHPLAWWVARRLRVEAEHAPVDCAPRHLGIEKSQQSIFEVRAFHDGQHGVLLWSPAEIPRRLQEVIGVVGRGHSGQEHAVIGCAFGFDT